MYNVTELFKQKIKENTRIFKLSVQIQHSSGVLELTDKDIVGSSVAFTESSQVGDDFNIGGVVASTLDIEIFRKVEHNLINFEGATIIPQVGLLISSSVDTENYFINAPQPSEFEDSQLQEQWEFVPLGRFNIDEAIKARNTIKLKAIDNMIELDKPYSLSQLGYPATLYQIYMNICTVTDIQPATTSFTNQDYLVNDRPEGDYTFRDMAGFVAELSGSFARCNRNGALELAWYEPTDLTLTGANRFDFKPREDLIKIKGIKVETEDTVYLAGTDDYVVDLTDNPLLQGSYETILANIYNKVKDTEFTPYESRWQGNPALQAGDIITQVDRDGNSHLTLVTHSTYKYRGASNLSAKGMPLKAKGYKSSTNKKIAEIKRKIEKVVGDKLTSLEQAQLNVTELIANMLGGYVIKDEINGIIYIADNQDINIAQKIWKWGIGGFGYSNNGVNGPYTTGISADGTIVAMLVAADIVTASMVQTGAMTSNAGNMTLDLDNNIMRIADDLGHNRVLLGEYETDKFGLQIKDSVNNQTLLDDKGLLNSWQQNMTENFDSNHPAKLKFYLPPNAGDIINLNLSFSLEKFRSYVSSLGSGGSQSVGTSFVDAYPRNTSAEGGHTHSVSYSQYFGYSASSVGDHTHTFEIDHSHTINTYHNHQVNYAVYESTAPSNVGIKIDGVDRTSVLGGSWTGEINISDLNIKPYIIGNGWHTIEFFMPENLTTPVVGRVVANIFGMIFMYAPS